MDAHEFEHIVDQLGVHETVQFAHVTRERMLIAESARETCAKVANAIGWRVVSIERKEQDRYLIHLVSVSALPFLSKPVIKRG